MGSGDLWRPEELPGLICSAMNDNACRAMMQMLALGEIKPEDVLSAYQDQHDRLWAINWADFRDIRPERREADLVALHTFSAAHAWHEATSGVLRLAVVLRP